MFSTLLFATLICLIVPQTFGANSTFQPKIHDTCTPNQNEHPINMTANCKEARFPLHFDNYSEFTAAIEFDPISCIGHVELVIRLNECEIHLAKADIPGGSVIVVNRQNHNLISGNRLSLTLNDDNLIIKEGSRQFQMKSNCTLTQKNGSVQVDTVIENSHPQCKALISLDSNAKFYGANSALLWAMIKQNLTFFIIAIAIILICIFLLVLIFCLWRLNSLPGTKLVTPRTGHYKPKSIEDAFPNAYPVHFKPTEERITRSSQTAEIHKPQPAVIVEKYEPTDEQLKL